MSHHALTRTALGLGLALALLAVLPADRAGAQLLDETMVPRGHVRLQAHGIFESWGDRFGRTLDGTESLEPLGQDLTDPTAFRLYPGLSSLQSQLRSLGAGPEYAPVLGSSSGTVTHDRTTIDWGIEVGVFDWLTVGGTLPWVRPRTAIDLYLIPDTIAGDLGLNPTLSDPTNSAAFLGSSATAASSTQAAADAECAGGVTAACATAQALAQRARDYDAAIQAAYGASPFFPLVGSAAADALTATTTTLSEDLVAAGLSSLLAPAFAGARITEAELATLPQILGAGIEGRPLRTSPGLYAAGDAEVFTRVRLLDNLTPERRGPAPRDSIGVRSRPRPGFGYRLVATGLVRLPTGTPEDPNAFLDLGTGDGQMDVEGSAVATLVFGGRLGLTAGLRYGRQGSTTVTKRVALPEVPMPTVDTRTELTWSPGDYVALGIAPTLYIADGLSISGEYRYFEKRRDAFELVTSGPLDPFVLELESGVTQHHVGGGLRYDTVAPWLWGEAPYAVEMHVRFLHAIAGGGGQAPESTRVEAGLRLFKRLWGTPVGSNAPPAG